MNFLHPLDPPVVLVITYNRGHSFIDLKKLLLTLF